MGKHDFIIDSLGALGADLIFHKAAIRPGKPICFAQFSQMEGRPVFFGLPGNPISTAVGLRFFVEPYLRALLGLAVEEGVSVTLENGMEKPSGFRCFYKGRAKVSKGIAAVEILQGQASYVVSSLLEANCWAILEEDAERVAPGSTIRIFPLNNSFEKGLWS